MKSGIKDMIWKAVTIVMVATIIVIGCICGWPIYQRCVALKRREANLDERIELMKRSIAELKDNQRRFQSDREFVEKIARQNRRVYPGELVFIFED